MKVVLFVVALLALLWLLKRSTARRAPPPRDNGQPAPQQMLACTQCGLHLPRDEALPGRGGVFCSDAHRSAYEQAHPGPR